MTKLRHRSAQTRKLNLERLEGRSCLAASVIASLTSQGVLQIEGTTKNDNIVVTLASNKVSVAGVATKFAAAQVTSISINTIGGNDVVNLSGLGKNWSTPITVYNSAGSDQVIRTNKARATYSAGTFSVGASSSGGSGGTTGATTTNWFDANIKDTALRALLKTDFADNKLNRTEMIAVFKQVGKDGTVSSNEYSDLYAVANNSSLFTSVDYVGVLTKDVVLSNAANAKYQGTTLGNLKSGSTGAQLDKLVGKWFLGAVHPVANYGSTTFAYAGAKGSLFASGGPKYSDVVQGALGDCYFVATLGEIALKSPSTITSMFIVNGDGTFTVRFFNNGKAEYVTVDGQVPVDQWGRFVFANMGAYASSTSNVLWVALAEKAYVQINEMGWLRASLPGNGINSYQSIAGGWFSSVSSQVANRVSQTLMFGSSSTFTDFANSFNTGKLVGFASKSSPTSSLVVGNHQYVAVAVNTSTQTVTLFNPWGVNNGSRYPGLVTLKWSEIAASFSYWDRA
jgi:hypothetical protein